MKKLLLSGVAACAIAYACPVRADLPVIDVTAIGDLLEQIGIQGDQLTEMIATFNEVVQVYNMTTNVWQSVAELVGADQWAPGLSTSTMRNPLPYAAAQYPRYVGGFGDPSGLPFGAQFLAQNTVGGNPGVYLDHSFTGGELFKEIQAFASMQSTATNHVQTMENRIAALGDLFTKLASIGTVQETDSLSARLHNELNFMNSQASQAQQALAAAQIQRTVFESNQRQWQYQDETNGIAAACGSVAAAASFVTVPACAAGAGAGGAPAPGGGAVTTTTLTAAASN